MMFKKLAVPFLVLTLGAAFNACSSDSNNNGGTGGKSGTGGAGTGGAGTGGAGSGGAGTGGAGTGGAGTGGAGTGGTVMDAGTGGSAADAPADISGDTGGDTGGGNICAAYVAGSGMLAGISAMDFCKEYSTVCTFGGAMRYTNMGDCVSKYDAASTSVKTCRAGHLCNAAMAGGATTHCPHATGLQLPACM